MVNFRLYNVVMPVIRVEDVSYHIGGATLIDHLSLTIEAGETVVLLGRSGSGKTTTLKLINRLLIPNSGAVFVESKSTTEWDPILLRRRIGYVIQEVGLFPHLTIAENVGLVPRLEKWEKMRIHNRVQEVLRLVGLEPEKFANRYPHQLSGGQRQRVGVARALCADPPILLMDEPFGALDPITRSEIQNEFKQLQSRLRKTLLFVTHDVAEAFLFGDRIGLMEQGKLIALATGAEFLASEEPAIKHFLSPFKNMASVLATQ
jgi:osmoprotectant transport system ATP-binding protein